MNAAARHSRPRFSPQGRWNQVSPEEVRVQLRHTLSRWGRPETIRVDNGSPWGSKGDFPTELAMWLIGLGIGMIWNTPRRPQENGVVERSQGTGNRWCEPGTCESPTELQTRLEKMDQLHREVYPYRERLSRLAYYPSLAHNGRLYSTELEAALWDWRRVTAHLSGYVGARRVNKNGDVSIYDRAYYVGVRFQGQEVYVTFDPETIEWVFSDESGRELRHKAAREITPERVMALDVTNRR
jgi:Mu transposase, C-terminal